MALHDIFSLDDKIRNWQSCETGDWKLGTSIEVGYKPIKDLRLGLGYTFTEYNEGDKAHEDQNYLSRGPYLKLTISPSF